MAAAVASSAPMNGGQRPMTPNSQHGDEAPLPPVPSNHSPREELDPSHRERLQHVLSSDIGMNTLLNRLKQSISSTRDFANFLKERSLLEDKHSQGLKRLTRSIHEAIPRPESRQGSFAHNYRELTSIHERMADHGVEYSKTLFIMSEELYELAGNSEKGRKNWKQIGQNAEKRVQDAESAMEKAKSRYNSLAEQYDRARTGEKQSGKFGLKKSAAAAEEDLRHKLEGSDEDYQMKVKAAQGQRSELLSTHRPQTVNALQELIQETDLGLSVHVQKFAFLSEKLLLGYGLAVTPMKGSSPLPGGSTRSLREVASNINNERDFTDYVLSFSNKAPSRASEIKYEQHPSLSPKQQRPGFSEQSYTDDSYAQRPPSHGRQVSGVIPSNPGAGSFEDSRSYDQPPAGMPPHMQQNPQMRGAMQRTSTDPPQLPQIEPSSGGLSNDPVSPVGQSGANHFPSGHSRNMSSMGSQGAFGALGQHPQPVRSPSPQFDDSDGRRGLQMGPGPIQAPMARGQNLGMGRDAPQGVSQGGPPNAMGRGQPPLGMAGPGPQGVINQMQAPYGTMSRGQSSDGGMNQGQSLSSGMPLGQNPSGGIGGQPQQPPSSMGRGQPPFGGIGSGQSQGGMGRGMPPMMGRGQVLPGQGSGMQQNMPPQPERGMSGLSSNGPLNGAPRAGGIGGVNALPSRQAAQRAGPPVRPVFGVSLDELFQREGSAVPVIVMQCIQAVDVYGLNVEGIYRTSGSANHIMELRQQFDHDANSVDFRTPAAFFEDIASVTTLLKHFLRDLPDPLLTAANYRDFIQAARVDEDVVRRDSIHALVNALPDPNYATLRVLAIHLHRIAQHSERNKMTQSNLAIVFAPTLMGQHGGMNGNGGGSDIADAGWQAKVVETILNHVFQIFDPDE